jgi:hypothetical protein
MDGLFLKYNLTSLGLNQAGDRPQGCAFTGTVCAQYGDNPASGHLQGNAFQSLDISIVGLYRLEFKHDTYNPEKLEPKMTTS